MICLTAGGSKLSSAQKLAFQYFSLFRVQNRVNLFDPSLFPQAANLELVEDSSVRENWKQQLPRLNEDQKGALSGLSSVPAGIFILPGCAGSGKTTWSMMSLVYS
jgi:type II secretory ATPase GspE/PulE/Tfp pilus assembly ATPase PilB-like protein